MESLFPHNKQEEDHLYAAFKQIETERVELLLRKHGIVREAKVIKYDFKNASTKWWMAAAILLITVSSYLIYLNTSSLNTQQLADNSLVNINKDYNFSVRSNNVSEQLIAAQISINNEQWIVAEKQLETALSTVTSDDSTSILNIYFCQAIVAVKQVKYNDAIDKFSTVANANSINLKKDAIWLRGLVYIKVENFEAAKIDLQSTAEVVGWKKAQEATKILKSLNN